MRKRRYVPIAAVLFVLAATTACGARLNDAQFLEATGGGSGGEALGPGNQGSGTGNSGDSGSSGSSGSGGSSTTAPTGSGSGNGGTGNSAAPCSASATDAPGVSDTEIKLGNVSTISGPVPNFGATGRAGAKAYLDYVNAQGGVCGRKLSLVPADDRLDPGTNRSATQSLAGSVFGFVGNTSVEDDGGAAVIGGTNIPNCSLAIGNDAVVQPNYYSPNPIEAGGQTNNTTPIWNWFKANKGITKVGIVYPDNPNAAARIQGYVNDIKAAGLTADAPIKVAVTESNYVGVASRMRDNGDDAFITVLEVNGISKLAQAIRQVGWEPKVPFFGAQAYGPQLIELAGSAAEGTTLGLTHDIVEGGGTAMQTMQQFYESSSSGLSLDFFAIMGWTAAKLCVDAIRSVGGAPTRDSVIAALNAVTDYTAEGLLAPRSPGAHKGPNQFVIVTIAGGAWQRVYPSEGFASS